MKTPSRRARSPARRPFHRLRPARLTSNWQAYGAGGSRQTKARRGDDPHVFRLDARRRCEEALTRLGPYRAVFERICLEGTALGVIERGFGLPKGAAKHHVKRPSIAWPSITDIDRAAPVALTKG
ncbi:MAG: DUF6456 domain-containing protein [Asticcacaulis sp.]